MDALGGGTGAPMQPVSSSSVHTHVSLIRELHNACSLLASQAQAPRSAQAQASSSSALSAAPSADVERLLTQCRSLASTSAPLEALAYTSVIVAALVTLRRFDEARAELARIGSIEQRADDDDTVPFMLRKLDAEMPKHFGRTDAASKRLAALAAMCGRRAATADAKKDKNLWERRRVDVLAAAAALRFTSGDAVAGAQACASIRDACPTDPRAWCQLAYAQVMCGADESARNSVARAQELADAEKNHDDKLKAELEATRVTLGRFGVAP